MAKPSVQMFAKFPNILGSSKEPGHTGWVPAFNFDLGFGTNDAGPRTATRHTELPYCVLTLAHDRSTPALMEASLKGEEFAEVVLDICRRVGKTLKLDTRLKLQKIVPDSIRPVGKQMDLKFSTPVVLVAKLYATSH